MHEPYIADIPGIHASELQEIAPLVQASIAAGAYPGAVILSGHQGNIIYRGVFGNQAMTPTVVPMHFHTIFDVASLTKIMVTAPAIMQLAEHGLITLDAKVATYWPAFAEHGKDQITLRDLLIHTSGLPDVIASPELNEILPAAKQAPNVMSWHGKAAALQIIQGLKPLQGRGEKFIYSDINYIVLGYIIERISRERLDHYAYAHIFKPLGLQNTFFLPPLTRRKDIAPTEIMRGELRWGEVHDPTAWLMGGVAGMAGLFSTAHDIGVFADMLLQQGMTCSQQQLLSADSIQMMTTPQTPADLPEARGLGFDIRSPLACGGKYFSTQSYGHTGWTGTSLWIDPVSQTWLVILTSRVHPHPQPVNPLLIDRLRIADLVGSAVSGVKASTQTASA